MRSPSSNRRDQRVAPHVLPALGLLLDVQRQAENGHCRVQDMAVPIDRLRAVGITDNDLRRLIHQGCLEHASAGQRRSKRNTSAGRNGQVAFNEKSCFLLTVGGVEFARRACCKQRQRSERNGRPDRSAKKKSRPRKPHWDPHLRILRLGDKIVKHFKQPARNQTAILDALQEMGWPKVMDDPLSPDGEHTPKQRFSNAICKLNLNQQNRLIRFHGDGTGERICWELVEE